MKVMIDGPSGPLEASVEEGSDREAAYALICHPHPVFGGTMDNKVVTTVARALNACGLSTIRFNFRGTGASAGRYDDGRGETEDAAAVAAWGAHRWGARALVLAGFSFGAYVAMRLAQSLPPSRLILIAPPVGRFEFTPFGAPQCPWLIVQGDADDVVDPEAVRAWAEAHRPAARLLMLAGVGHYFHGHLVELRDAIETEIRSG
jgi:alpha/beta superfamily hydrolase